MADKTTVNFTEGPILSALLKFAIPILGALFLQAAYGAVDLIVVGKFGEASGVSAVGTGTSIMQLVTFVIVGIAMGATIVIGQHIGERKPEEAGETVGASVVLFMLIALGVTVLMEFFAVDIVRLMQTPAEAFDKTLQYVRICSGGLIFIVAYNVISSVFRGLGNSRLPLVFVTIACIVNVVGDLIFIGVFGWDVMGAALATVLAQAVSVVLSLVIIMHQELPFKFSLKQVRFNKKEISRILYLGCPIAAQDVLVQISFLIINAIVNNMGLDESAGYGVSARIQAFIMLVPSATMQGVSAFVAQNVGAGKLRRARKTLYTAMKAGITAGVFLFSAGFFGGDLLASAFTNDPAVIEQGAAYLKGFSADCLLTCILFSCIGYFNGRGETIYVMLQGITSAVLVRVPISYLISRMDGVTLTHIALAAPITTVYGIIFCWFCIRHAKKHHVLLTKMEAEENEKAKKELKK